MSGREADLASAAGLFVLNFIPEKGNQRIKGSMCFVIMTFFREGDGLRSRKVQGASDKIPDELANQIKRWVIDGPAKQRLAFANWTYAELADHLFKTHGIRTSRGAMHRFCSTIGIRPYRPTNRFRVALPTRGLSPAS